MYRALVPPHVLEAVPRQANRPLWSYLCSQAERAVSALDPQPLAARVRSEISDSVPTSCETIEMRPDGNLDFPAWT